MSLAAGIVPSGEVHREDGPATCAAAHAQQRAGSRKSARLPQRTFTWKPVGFSPRRFLEVLAVLRRAQTGSCEHRRVRNHLRTEFSSVLENARVGQGRSQWDGALGVAVRAQRVTHHHRPPVTRPQRPWRKTVGVGHLDCGRWRRCFSSACPRHCSSPRAAARSSNLTQRPSATRGCRSPGEPGRAGKGRRRTRRTQEALWTTCGRHRRLRAPELGGGPKGRAAPILNRARFRLLVS